MEIFSFGERLMIYRKRAGFSKKELAKRVGISVSTLTKYENDESQPNVDMLTDLAIALDISVMKLLSGFGDPIREKILQLYRENKACGNGLALIQGADFSHFIWTPESRIIHLR